MKNFLKFVRNNMSKSILGLCTIVMAFLAFKTYQVQQQFKSSYSSSAQQIMINAENIELSDIDVLFDDIYHTSDMGAVIFNADNELGQMKENYKIIQQLQAVNFPNKQALNYQVLRINLKSDIDVLEQNVNTFKAKSEKQSKISDSDKKSFLFLLAQMRQQNKASHQRLVERKQIKNSDFVKEDKDFDKAYGKTVDDLLKKGKSYVNK